MKDNRPLNAGRLLLVHMSYKRLDFGGQRSSSLKLWAIKEMIQSSFQNSHDNRIQVNHILYIKRFLSWFSASLLFFVSQSCSKCPQLLFCTLVTSPHSPHPSFSGPSHHLRLPGCGFENSLLSSLSHLLCLLVLLCFDPMCLLLPWQRLSSTHYT